MLIHQATLHLAVDMLRSNSSLPDEVLVLALTSFQVLFLSGTRFQVYDVWVVTGGLEQKLSQLTPCPKSFTRVRTNIRCSRRKQKVPRTTFVFRGTLQGTTMNPGVPWVQDSI